MSVRRSVKTWALAGMLLLLQVHPSFAQEAGAPARPAPAASSIAGPLLVKAQKQLAAGKEKLALATLSELDNLMCTEADRYLRLRMTASAHSKLGNLTEVEPAFAALIASPVTPETEKAEFFEGLLGLLMQRRDDAGVIALIQSNPELGKAPHIRRYLVQTYHSAEKYLEAYQEIIALVQKAEADGQRPENDDLIMAADLCLKLDQSNCLPDALERLVRHYPQPSYWKDLLSRMARGDISRETKIEVMRLADATGYLLPSQVPVMIGYLMADNSLNEASAMVARGLPANAFGPNPDPDRLRRFNEKFAEVKQKKQGAKVSGYDLLFSAAPADAVPAIRKELAAALPADIPVLTLHLGIAQAAVGDYAGAEATLLSVTGLPSIERAARMWTYHLRAKGAAAVGGRR